MRIGVIGVGHLATDVVSGWLDAGVSANDILLAPRGAGVASLARRGIAVASDNADVIARSDVVLWATRPLQAIAAMGGLPWRADQIVMSCCAGLQLDVVAEAVRPANVVRVVPLGSAAQGASPTLMFPEHQTVHALFERVGTVTSLSSEDEFSAAQVAGVLYAGAHAFVGITEAWLATRGIPAAAARNIAAGNLAAAVAAIRARPSVAVSDMVAAIATPGGVADRAFARLDIAELEQRWTAALDAGLERMREYDAASRHRT